MIYFAQLEKIDLSEEENPSSDEEDPADAILEPESVRTIQPVSVVIGVGIVPTKANEGNNNELS